MSLLVALTLLSAATIGSVAVYRRSSLRLAAGDGARGELSPPPDEPVTDRTLQTVRLGDVVLVGEDDWLITGTRLFREESERWWQHRLDDGTDVRWLEVRRIDHWRAAWLEPVDDVPLHGRLGDGLTWRARPYRLLRRGHARVDTDGDGDLAGGLVHYTHYEGPSGTRLQIEERDGDKRAFGGRELPTHLLSFMPGERPVRDGPSLDDLVDRELTD